MPFDDKPEKPSLEALQKYNAPQTGGMGTSSAQFSANSSPDKPSLDAIKNSMTPDQLKRYNNLHENGPTISTQDPLSYVRQGMSYVRGIGSSALGTVGAAASTDVGMGPIPGRVAGNLVGDQAYQILQHASPKVFGQPPEDFKTGIQESLLNTGADVLFSDLIPMAWRATKSGATKSLFKSDPMPGAVEDRAAIAADSNFPVSVGQATGSKLAKATENLFGGQKLKELQAKQQGHLTQSAEDFISSISHGSGTTLESPVSHIADISSNVIKQEAEKNKNIQNALYQQLEYGHVPNERATVAVPTTIGSNYWSLQHGFNKQFTNAEIEGPIRLLNTAENAGKINVDIDSIIKDPSNVFNPEDMKEVQLIKDKVASFTTDLPYDKNGNPTVSYQVAKAIKSGQIDFLQNTSDNVRHRLTGVIDNLKSSIGADMYDSVHGNISKGLPALWSPEAGVAYDAAINKFKQNLSRFSPQFAKDLAAGANPDIIQEKVIQQALESAKEMRQYKNAMDPTANEPLLLLAKNVLNKARDVSGVWDGEEGLKQLKEYIDSGVAKEAFPNSSSLQAFKYLLNRMRTVSPAPSNLGKVALTMNAARGASAVAGGALTFALTGNLAAASTATGAMVFASIPLANKVVSEFMLNPVNARKLAGIATSPPSSILAQRTMKQVITHAAISGALKGLIIDVSDQNGDPIGKATFDKNGKLVPVNEQQ